VSVSDRTVRFFSKLSDGRYVFRRELNLSGNSVLLETLDGTAARNRKDLKIENALTPRHQ
jgi:hypothetical protein